MSQLHVVAGIERDLAGDAGHLATKRLALARAWALGLRPQDALANNDGHGFFGALGDSVITGPTLTNVNDFRAILIEAEATPSR